MPKYADPAVYPVGTPAATDNVMTRTAAGADGNFALGNLAGIAGVAIATDQSVYLGSGGWASYSLTAQARTFLAATSQADQRTAIGLGTAGTANTWSAAQSFQGGLSVPTDVLIAARDPATNTAIASFRGTGAGTALVSGALGGAGTIQLAPKGVGFPLVEVTNDGGISSPTRLIANRATGYSSLSASGGTIPALINTLVSGSNTSRSEFRSALGMAQMGSSTVAQGDAAPTRFFEVSNDFIRPSVTNVMSCGVAGNVWTQVFATNTTISTSDARLKTEPRQLRDAEFKAASAIARLPAVWRWLNRVHGDENCEPEGREARKHFGPTVQAAIAVMEAHGLDPFAYSFVCYDQWEALPEQWHEWEAQEAVLDNDGKVVTPAIEAGRELVQEAREAGDRYSFRKEELLCFIVRALAQEIDGLAERVAELEAKV